MEEKLSKKQTEILYKISVSNGEYSELVFDKNIIIDLKQKGLIDVWGGFLYTTKKCAVYFQEGLISGLCFFCEAEKGIHLKKLNKNSIKICSNCNTV